MNKKKTLLGIFISLIVLFGLLVSYFVLPFSQHLKRTLFPVFVVFAVLFFILGGVLIFLVFKFRIKDKMFLLIVGSAPIGFLLSVLLHNFFYALGVYFKDLVILKYLFELLHAGFFIIGLIICPILFLIGIFGSIIFYFKK